LNGWFADEHLVDAKALSESLAGMNRLVNTSMFMLERWRVPSKRQSAPIRVMASPPAEGSYEFLIHVLSANGMLPVVADIIANRGQELVWRMLSTTLLFNSNKERDVEPHFTELMRLTQELRQDRNASDERHFELIKELALSNQNASSRLVANVGYDANKLLLPLGHSVTEIDIESAEIIREKGEVSVGELSKFRCHVDGLKRHNRALTVQLDVTPDQFTTAKVVDPVFDQPDNIYVRAYDEKRMIEISAKPFHRDDTIVKLVVMDAQFID
jgi:hypothetical protein